jgi:hypothetical protein
MALREIEVRHVDGFDRVVIDDEIIRKMTDEEIRKKRESILRGFGTPPFVGDDFEWLDHAWVDEMSGYENKCVKIVHYLGGYEL